MTNDEKALAVRNSKTRLRKRLNAAKAVLIAREKKYFSKTTFDFDNARLWGAKGRFLQWTNNGTTTGSVELWQRIER